ncbi:kinase-like domain-containing protein [Rhizophagus clarus]|uniref:Kinase-like domain-containing protein n=1 Tax=Rhizophagus clarus TaxID=94130 RepID=A0A8H3L3F3_9GLOM|nr:kinase-like domain-containing protein [Rhizophagus clarus]
MYTIYQGKIESWTILKFILKQFVTNTIYFYALRAYVLTDYNIYKNLDERYEFRKKTINEDESLDQNEKEETIRMLGKRYDYDKIITNEGIKRICDYCNKERLAYSYCEHCVRNYLKEKFSNWTSEKSNIDNLIRKCQMETLGPNKIIEWIPYDNFQNIEYFTKGGFSNIYLAKWIKGHYIEWSSEEKQLKRNGMENAILKELESFESANTSWFEEAKSHLTISNKWVGIIQCYGDLGFCGAVDKPLGTVYGNLPYIAPEVIVGRGYTKESDIYSVAMLMWEISSGQPPFINYEYDYYLAMKIVTGTRPKIVPGTPLKYQELIKRCWDANPKNRPDINTLWSEMMKINKSYHQNYINDDHSNNSQLSGNFSKNSNSMNLSCSRIYSFNQPVGFFLVPMIGILSAQSRD